MKDKKSVIALVLSALSLVIACTTLIMYCSSHCGKEEPSKETDAPSVIEVTAEDPDDSSAVKYMIYVGTNDKDTNKMEMTEEEARDTVDRICNEYFGGYTLQDAIGSWTDDDGTIVHEYSLVCIIDGGDEESVYKAADDMIKALNQSSILIEKSTIGMDYYSGK